MATLYRARVCAVGSERDMKNLLTRMLDNCGYLEADEELRPERSVEELVRLVQQRSREDGGEGDTFLFEMIAGNGYGDAIPCTLRLEVAETLPGLWTAVFSYDSEHSFQPEDWMILHLTLGRVLLVAQRASRDFALDKGELIFSGGQCMENWDHMCELWLWLMEQYGAGAPPQAAVQKLKPLARVLRDEEYDMDVAEILTACAENLQRTAERVADPEGLMEKFAAARENRDFRGMLEIQYAAAEAALWETRHNAKWLACLDAVSGAWTAEG